MSRGRSGRSRATQAEGRLDPAYQRERMDQTMLDYTTEMNTMLSQTIGTGSRYLGWVITRESGKIPSDETEKINKINDDAAYTYLAVQPRIEGIYRAEPRMLFLNGMSSWHPLASEMPTRHAAQFVQDVSEAAATLRRGDNLLLMVRSQPGFCTNVGQLRRLFNDDIMAKGVDLKVYYWSRDPYAHDAVAECKPFGALFKPIADGTLGYGWWLPLKPFMAQDKTNAEVKAFTDFCNYLDSYKARAAQYNPNYRILFKTEAERDNYKAAMQENIAWGIGTSKLEGLISAVDG